jgi:hypothetical protein
MGVAPLALIRSVIGAATASAWLEAIDAHPAWRGRNASDAAFNVHGSSLRLAAVPCLDAVAIARLLMSGDAGTFCRSRLGEALSCDVDQCWIRRQYAPSRYPPGHAPHAWHQDGALAFDFLDAAATMQCEALLEMVTCWIALTPCGADAPGLELAPFETTELLSPRAVQEAGGRLAAQTGELRRPVMEPGDCLVFGGGVLHHTYVMPTMRADRISLEIRLFDARHLPSRLGGDRFVSVP